MDQRDVQKAVEKALQEERRQQEWKNSLRRDEQKIKQVNKDARKALLGAITFPAATFGAAVSQNNHEQKGQQAEAKKKPGFVGMLLKIILLLILFCILSSLLLPLFTAMSASI